MSTRTIIVAAVGIVALLVFVAAALVWPQMQRRGLTINTDSSGQNARVHSGNINDETPGESKPGKRRPDPVVVTPSTPKEPKRPPFDLSKLEEGQVLLRAQVKLTSLGGIETLRAADHLPCNLCLRYIDESNEPTDNYFSFELDGFVESSCDIASLPIKDGALATAVWSAYICWGDTEGFAPIAAPKLEGRVLDFGTLELDLTAALAEKEWLFVGRLMHATGLPIYGLDTLNLQIREPQEQFWFEQHQDGHFASSYWGDVSADDRIWLVHNYDEDETLQELARPAMRGRIVDLGEIIVNCAAVEVRIDSWPDDNMRRQRRRLDAAAQLPELSANVYLSSLSYSTDIWVIAPQSTKVAFAMPGPYRWSATQSDETMAYGEVAGEVMLEAGKLARIDVGFVPMHSVLVYFKAAGEIGDIRFEAIRLDAEGEPAESFEYQIAASRQPLAVPNPEREKMKFTATTRGWVTVACDVAPETTELTIEFKERAQPTTGMLLVELPKLPEFFKEHRIEIAIFAQTTNAGKTQTQQLASYGNNSKFWGLTKEDELLRYEVMLGSAKVWLQETNQIYGYPRGLICGPVECTLTSDVPCKVKLPEFDAPPWSVAARQSQTRLTCEGVPMNYQGPILVGETSQVLSLQYNNNLRMSAGDYAIPDGTLRHELRMSRPTEQESTLLFEYDFPARIEIRVRRGKELVPSLITVNAITADRKVTVSATSRENGTLRIWVPQGDIQLSVQAAGTPYSYSKALKAGSDLTVVEFVVDGAFAQFNWDERYKSETGSHWWLRDSKGELVSSLNAETQSLKLAPGTYSMTPENANKPEITFEMPADGDVRVEIPFVPRHAETGSFLVKYPKDLKPDPDGYVVEWFWYVPLSGNVEQDVQNHEYVSTYGWMRYTHEGIKISGLPANLEIVIVLAVGAMDDEGNLAPSAWAAYPMRLTLKGGDMETIAVEWKRAVVLNHDWYDAGDLHWTGPDQAAMRYINFNRILLPGSYSATSYTGETPRVFNVALKIEPDKFFEMTPEIRKALNGEESED